MDYQRFVLSKFPLDSSFHMYPHVPNNKPGSIGANFVSVAAAGC